MAKVNVVEYGQRMKTKKNTGMVGRGASLGPKKDVFKRDSLGNAIIVKVQVTRLQSARNRRKIKR